MRKFNCNIYLLDTRGVGFKPDIGSQTCDIVNAPECSIINIIIFYHLFVLNRFLWYVTNFQ